MRNILFFLLALAAAGQTNLEAPKFGLVRDPAGTLRPLTGSPGSFLPGPVLAEKLTRAAWCGTTGLALVEQDSRPVLITPQGSTDLEGTIEIPLCLNQNAARQNEGQLEIWDKDHFTPWGPPINETILAIEANQILTRGDQGLTLLTLKGGTITASQPVPIEAKEATLLGAAVLYQDHDDLVAWSPDGTELRAPLPRPGTLRFEPLGPGWIHAIDFANNLDLAIRLRDGALQLFELPEVQP